MPGKDHRTRVTKMLIRRAFTDLLRVKPVQSISIKELCEKAGVNRGTFYAHYASVHDLLMQMEDECSARSTKCSPRFCPKTEGTYPPCASPRNFFSASRTTPTSAP